MTDSAPRQASLPPKGLRFVAAVTDGAYRHRGWVALAALALTVGSVRLASKLDIRSSFAELLPSELPSVRLMNDLLRRVGGDGTLLVTVEIQKDPGTLAKAEAWVPRLAADIRALGPTEVRSVEEGSAKAETWFENHWPLFVSLPELEQANRDLADEIHKRKAAQNPFALDLGDQPAAAPQAATSPWLSGNAAMPRDRVRQRFADHPDGFYVNPDGRSVTFIVRPEGTSLGVSGARALIAKVQALVEGHQAELSQDGLRVGLSGTFPQTVAEYEAILHDIGSTALLVVVLVLAALLVFFREIRPVVSLLAAIGVAVATTFGLTELIIGYLNTQTAFLGAIVVGNGINYGLVYLARLRQLRDDGTELPTALRQSAMLAARATLLASAASSLSFAVLAVAGNRGFRHFGLIGGVGMLLCWLATFTLMPAFLGLLDPLRKRRAHRSKTPPPGTDHRHAYPKLSFMFANPRALAIGVGVAALAALTVFLVRLPHAMETNLDNLSNALGDRASAQLARDNRRANDSLGHSLAATYALLPSLADADAYCAQIQGRMKDPKNAKLIEGCDTLSSVLPNDQPAKLAVIRQIAAQLTEGVRATLPPDEAKRAASLRDDLLAQKPVTIEDAPHALIDRFREKDGTLGGFAIVTARGDAKLELSGNLLAFAKAVRNVPVAGQKFDATGENVILADLLADINREGPRTTFLSFLGVCLLVMLFFSQWSRRLEVLMSLAAGVALMAGAGTVLGLKINFFNFIAFPVTFGIAVDYGANIAARIRARGGEVFPALAEVGPAVFLCSLTSMIGYATLLVSINRALRSFGYYALVGEITSVFTALVLLPSLGLAWRHFVPREAELRPHPKGVAA